METLFTSRIFKVVKKIVTGRSGNQLERHVIVHPGAVVVLPVLDDGRIVLIKQYRVSIDGPLIELPAGTLEPNEEPLKTARRELIEETGYAAGAMRPILTFYSSPGIMKEEMHLFLGTQLVAGPTDMEDGEQIETLLVDFDQSLKMINNGEIKDGKTILALYWWNANRPTC